jgi:hypothetical protein
MAKDPALLFYTSDFLTGTFTMTNEQVGIYIRLLCIQHQRKGFVDKNSFNLLINGHDIVREKFIETEEGFYNERLRAEMARRTAYSESRSKNRLSKKDMNDICQSYDGHMETETETITKEVNKRKAAFKHPTAEEVCDYCIERNNLIDPQAFVDFYESKDWMIGKNKMKDWKAAVRTWEKRSKEDKKAGDSPNKWNQLDKEYAAKYGDMK